MMLKLFINKDKVKNKKLVNEYCVIKITMRSPTTLLMGQSDKIAASPKVPQVRRNSS